MNNFRISCADSGGRRRASMLLPAALLALLLAGCANNEEERTVVADITEAYELARTSVSRGNYRRGVEIYEAIQARYPFSDLARQIQLELMDRSHLRQVLWNLCDNAVKYASETGGILVEIRAGRQQGLGRPYLEVLDHGLGVDPAVAERIFEPFYTERSGGTGLGLYISRELCELNRATLFYLDRPGGGSIFRIVFADPDRWEPDDEGPLDTDA